MDFTVYLPDELGKRAKAAELPLSRMLRDAVTEELERQQTVSNTLSTPQTFDLDLQDADGRWYVGRVTGTEIAINDDGDVVIYLTDDERVIAYEAENARYTIVDDPESDLRSWLPNSNDAYMDAMNALGLKPIIDL